MIYGIVGFVFGILFVYYGLPILEATSEIVAQIMEAKKIKPMIKTQEGNAKLLDLQAKNQEINTQAIGFIQPEEYEYYEDDEDRLNNNCESNKSKKDLYRLDI